MLSYMYSKTRHFINLAKGLIKLVGLLRKKGSTRTPQDSRDQYNLLDNRDQIAYETESKTVTVDGLYKKIPVRELRQFYLEPIYNYIDTVLANNSGKPISILEVGCGNCINIINIREKYGDAVRITGMDISDQRIIVAKKHFGDSLDDIDFTIASITEGLDYQDGEFDIVYSMHCLEQIA